MPDYSTLTDREINAMLAEKMGLVGDTCPDDGGPFWIGPSGAVFYDWSPCTSRDDLAVVVEHLVQGWLGDKLNEILHHTYCTKFDHRKPIPVYSMLCLTCPPRIIAECCLEVLNG